MKVRNHAYRQTARNKPQEWKCSIGIAWRSLGKHGEVRQSMAKSDKIFANSSMLTRFQAPAERTTNPESGFNEPHRYTRL
jgi:hypothetical protein